MTEQERKKGGGSKLTRSETVTVRLDPKLRYLAELAARQQRRTVSSFIEWAIEEMLCQMPLNPKGKSGSTVSDDTIMSEASCLWDVEDADRFAKLALRYEYLLTHEEQVLWKLVRENGYLWRGNYNNNDNEWSWNIRESSLIFERLRDNWEIFKAVASGDGGKDALPTWIKKKTNAEEPYEEPPFHDDDIPF